MESVNDWFRSILWSLISGLNRSADSLYEKMNDIFLLNPAKDMPWIRDWLEGLSILLFLFILLRLLFLIIKTMFDEQCALNGLLIMKRLLMIGLVVTLVPIGIPSLADMSASSIARFTQAVNIEPSLPSEIVLESMRNDERVELPESYDRADFINEIDDYGDYLYYPEFFDLFEMLLISSVVLFVLLNICIQYMKRLFDLAMKMLMVPYALSGMIDESDHGFSEWLHSCMGDILANLFQAIGLLFVVFALELCALEGMMKTVFYIAGLLAVSDIPKRITAYTEPGEEKKMLMSVIDLFSYRSAVKKEMNHAFRDETIERREHSIENDVKNMRIQTAVKAYHTHSVPVIPQRSISYSSSDSHQLRFFAIEERNGGGMALRNNEYLIERYREYMKKDEYSFEK